MTPKKTIYVGNIKEIPVGESMKFKYPVGDEKGTTKPGLLIHLEDGFVAYEALCTHMHAEIEYNKYTGKIWCTLHDGMYNPKSGAPFMGMPKESLKAIDLKIEKNGDIYALV
jgi:nitrite reductase/ring-hydroxylating ferredoxin subunit